MGDSIEQFLLSISPMGSGDRPNEKFLIRTEIVPKGAPLGQEEVVWPLDHWIDQAQLLSGDPLVAMLNPQDAATKTPSAFGNLLYDQLFQKSIRDSWLVSQGVAQSQRQVLQLRLGLKGDRLARLPWEALSGDGRTLTTGTETTFSRYRLKFGHQSAARDNIDQLRFHHRLRILMAVSEPDDRDRLELSQEVEKLKDELAKLQDSDQPLDITIDVLEQPDRGRLTQSLEQGQYQVFHYAGHSSSGPDGGNLHLVSSRTGLTEMLSGQDLAGLLVNNGVLLAFFNSCQGSYSAAGGASKSLLAEDKAIIDNLAAALVERGVPGVLAMSENIPDEVALTLMQLFYRNLRPDYSVDLSLSRVRQGLVSAYGSSRFYWALPILYLHPDFDGFLFKPMVAPGGDFAWSMPLPDDDDEQLSADWDMAAEPTAQSTRQSAGQSAGSPTDALPSGLASQSSASGAPLDLPPFNLRPSQQSKKAAAKAAKVSGTPAIAPSMSQESAPSSTWQDRLPKGRRSVPWVLGGLVVATFGVGGLLWNPEGPDPVTSNSPNSSDLPNSPAQNFAQGDQQGVWQKLEALLGPGQNNLGAAAAIVNGIPKDWDDAEAFFWRGRLAWQAAKTGQQNQYGSVDDALRYWSQTVTKSKDSVVYQAALGFAHYQAGNFEDAEIQWENAVKLAGQRATEFPTTVVPGTQAGNEVEKLKERSRLNAHAGLALINWRKGDRDANIPEVQYHLNIVNSAAGSNYADDAFLGNDWMWSQKTLSDWKEINTLQ
ncbi:MAG: CHAT domain-containing protein [Cyanophyceae cyanobacterium]